MLRQAFAGLLVLSSVRAALPVWPEPTRFDSGSDVLWFDPDVKVRVSCQDTSESFDIVSQSGESSLHRRSQQRLSDVLGEWQVALGFPVVNDTTHHDAHTSEDDILRGAVQSTLKSIGATKLVPWKFHSRRSSYEPTVNGGSRSVDAITISQSSCSSNGFNPAKFFNADESYKLQVGEEGIVITTKSVTGTLNALQTLRQLFYVHSVSKKIYTPYAPVLIEDEPRWRYRGISLDIARNPFTVEDVLKTIATMATVKLNRLHIHGTDSQSWPIDIPSLPELAAKGAYQPDLVWSAHDLARVQQYGVSHGVQVFLELDMPGHTASIAHAYPDLIAAFDQIDWSTFAAEPLSGQLKLNDTRVSDFLDTLFHDLLPRLSRYSSIYHLGGDEVNRIVHLLDETVQSSDHAILQPLIQAIMQRIYNHAIKHNLRPMIWEEMILEWNLTFSSPHLSQHKPLVQAWRSSNTITTLLQQDHSVIFGDSQHWYLDCGFGEFFNPYPSGLSPPGVPYNTSGGLPTKLSPPFLDYCGPYHNWKAIYTFNPLANISEELWAGIEGGEALLWSELTDSVDLDFKLWPRAAAAAEVLWRGPREQGQLVDATRRLAVWRERVVGDIGVRAGNVQMTWCLMEGGCEL